MTYSYVQISSLLFLCVILFVASLTDIKSYKLPDNITQSLLWVGLLLNSYNIFTSPKNAIIGATCGYLSLWFIAYCFKLIRKIDGLGHGDFKLFAAFGAWFGWSVLPIILFIASLLGSIIGIVFIVMKKHKPTKPIPFGPFLSCSLFFVIIFIVNNKPIFYNHKILCLKCN